MKKKVAIIIERLDIALGGAERSVLELATELSSIGIQTDILAAKGRATTENVRIICKDNPCKRTSYFTFSKALQKYLKENRYDIVHSVLPFGFADIYQPRTGSIVESFLRNAASYENKFMQSYKAITAFTNFRRTTLWNAEQSLCKNPDGPVVAALSQYVAEQFRKHYGIAEKRIAVIPNGVKIDRQIDPAETVKLQSQIFGNLNISDTDKPTLMLFAANNFRLKGLANLIRAVAEASKSSPDFCLIVVGNASSRHYRHLAKKLGLDKKIVFLSAIPGIHNIMPIIDVAVLPTFYDPASRFILEAIAAGKPVITTKFNGAADMFIDGRHGKVIDQPQNITALAEAISHFANKENIQNASKAIADDNLKSEVSITRVAGQLELLYESILQNR